MLGRRSLTIVNDCFVKFRRHSQLAACRPSRSNDCEAGVDGVSRIRVFQAGWTSVILIAFEREKGGRSRLPQPDGAGAKLSVSPSLIQRLRMAAPSAVRDRSENA
jgi:hypothetical protein